MAKNISIHALREEGDPPGKCKKAPIPRFQSTPSARRATQTRAGHTWGRTDFNPRPPRGERLWSSLSATMISSNFNPRPPRGGRPFRARTCARVCNISIHALREESDKLYDFERTKFGAISIHALREESDRKAALAHVAFSISIHALREESDGPDYQPVRDQPYFNPRPPRGERLRSFSG